jgi:hypothetical protein
MMLLDRTKSEIDSLMLIPIPEYHSIRGVKKIGVEDDGAIGSIRDDDRLCIVSFKVA